MYHIVERLSWESDDLSKLNLSLGFCIIICDWCLRALGSESLDFGLRQSFGDELSWFLFSPYFSSGHILQQ